MFHIMKKKSNLFCSGNGSRNKNEIRGPLFYQIEKVKKYNAHYTYDDY